MEIIPQEPLTFLQKQLDQSMCSDKSSFNRMPRTLDIQEASLKIWTTRLIYWSMHYDQTRHARAEAIPRQQQTLKGADCYPVSSSVGPYDYECPNAKYIVFSHNQYGLGANVRLNMVYSYLAGLI